MKVFVYGTLRRGGRFHPLLRGCTFEGEGVIFGYDLYDLGGDVPGIVVAPKFSDHAHTVVGEVYTVEDPLVLQRIRMLERGYAETEIHALVEGQKELQVVAYVWPNKGLPYAGTEKPTLIPSGDWMNR